MNLKLPFDQTDPAALDERLAEIDRELDVLFLEAVEREQERLRREREHERGATRDRSDTTA